MTSLGVKSRHRWQALWCCPVVAGTGARRAGTGPLPGGSAVAHVSICPTNVPIELVLQLRQTSSCDNQSQCEPLSHSYSN